MSQTEGGHVHAFIVDDGIDLTLIDTLYDDDASVILAELSAMHRQPSDIKRILLTHSHKSHLGGLAHIAAMSGAAVYAHESEVAVVENQAKAKAVGWRLPKPFNVEVFGLQAALNFGIGKHEMWVVHDRLVDGKKVGPLECLSVPGHTPGCTAFWIPSINALIAGDTVASWPTLDVGWPSFNLDQKQAVRSVGKMSELSQCKILCVGHGDPILDGGADILKRLSA